MFEFDPQGRHGRFLRRFVGHVSLVSSDTLIAKVREAGFVAVEAFAASPG